MKSNDPQPNKQVELGVAVIVLLLTAMFVWYVTAPARERAAEHARMNNQLAREWRELDARDAAAEPTPAPWPQPVPPVYIRHELPTPRPTPDQAADMRRILEKYGTRR